MKKIVIAMAFVCLATSATYAQKINEDKVPATALSNFKKQFATATKAQWEMDDADFEVNFKNNGIEYAAKYDKQGNWLETEQEIKKSELPVAVKQAVEKEFPKAEIEETEKVTYPNNIPAIYEMEIEKDKQKFEVQFSAEGKLLKKEVMPKKEGKQ
ncbi:MAG: PepSY-like domain-containing protein [Bacteroidia bacterium]